MSTGRRRDCSENLDGGKKGNMSQSTANTTINKDTMNEDEGGEREGVVATRGRIQRRRRNASIDKKGRRRIAILTDNYVYNIFLLLPGQHRCCVPQPSSLSLSTLSLRMFPSALSPST